MRAIVEPQLPYLGLRDLLENKRASGRTKDLLAIERSGKLVSTSTVVYRKEEGASGVIAVAYCVQSYVPWSVNEVPSHVNPAAAVSSPSAQ